MGKIIQGISFDLFQYWGNAEAWVDNVRLTNVGSVTKHYYANGGRIATRVDDANGEEVGYVYYDPYGNKTMVNGKL